MSQFPRRLIDELDEGETRRLLRSARADAPPSRLVAAAIAHASKTAHASESESSRSGSEPGSQPSSPKLGRRNVALVAGALVVGAVVLWANTRELQFGTGSGAAAPSIGERPVSTSSLVEPSAPEPSSPASVPAVARL